MLLLLACGLPLTEGPYLFSTVSQQNSCGWEDDTWGVGTSFEVDLSWPDADTIWLEQNGMVLEYAYEGGGSFSGEGGVDQEVQSPCFVHFDILDEGVIKNPTSFVVKEFVSVTEQGDCSRFDTTMLPCEAQLKLQGEMKE